MNLAKVLQEKISRKFCVIRCVFLLVELLEVSLEEQDLRQYNAMGHMFGYPGRETFIVAYVMQHSRL